MSRDMQSVPLDSLARLITDKTFGSKDPSQPYVGLEHMQTCSPDLIGHANAVDSVSVNGVFERDDILFGKLRPNLRKSVLAPFRGYCSTDILVLRANAGVHPGFVARTFQSEGVFARAVQTSIGTKMPRTSWAALRHLLVYAPSLLDQEALSCVFDQVDEQIRKTEQLVAKLKLVKQGQLHDLLTRGIDDNGELRDPDRHPEQFKDSPLGLIPKQWIATHLGEVLHRATYGGSEALGAGPGIPVLRMNNLRDGEADLGDLKYSDHPCYRRLLLRVGDVLFNRTNSIDHVGRTGIWRGQIELASFASYLVRLEPDPLRLRGEFLNGLLNWDVIQLRIRRYATPGVHQVNINPTNLRRTMVALPASTDEQDLIAGSLFAADRQIRTELRHLAKLRLFKQALMDDLLTGRVRVTPLLEGSI